MPDGYPKLPPCCGFFVRFFQRGVGVASCSSPRRLRTGRLRLRRTRGGSSRRGDTNPKYTRRVDSSVRSCLTCDPRVMSPPDGRSVIAGQRCLPWPDAFSCCPLVPPATPNLPLSCAMDVPSPSVPSGVEEYASAVDPCCDLDVATMSSDHRTPPLGSRCQRRRSPSGSR